MSRAKILIIGAGLQGCSVALALASRGYSVTLLEQHRTPMSAASLRNEGKIHLGFVYALDASGETVRLMLQGALSFSTLLDRWCGKLPWHDWRTQGFYYAVMPDSLCSANQLEKSYDKLSLSFNELSQREGNDYLGTSLTWLWRRCKETPSNLFPKTLPALDYFETQEASIDPAKLAYCITEKITSNQQIEFCGQAQVLGASKRGEQYLVDVITSSAHQTYKADFVINCAWENRELIDRTLGLPLEPRSHSYRVKYQILVKPKSNHAMRALTMVQGPYGDLVPWSNGLVYISWYPIGRVYFSDNPPDDRFSAREQSQKVAQQTLSVFSEFFPELKGSEIISSHAGVIVAEGMQDLDKPQSDLHRRNNIGPRSYQGWWSVNTGKLTTAPFFAEQVAQELHDAIKS